MAQVSYGTITISDLTDGASIWTTTIAPTTPNYTFTISNLQGSESTPKIGDIILYDTYRYTITTVNNLTVLANYRQSLQGTEGRGVESIETKFINWSTNTESNAPSTSNTWYEEPPAFNSQYPYYYVWVRTIYTDHINPTDEIYLDNSVSYALNKTTEIDALNAQAKYFWWDEDGAHIASGLTSSDSNDNIQQSQPASYGFNALTAPGFLKLRYEDVDYVQLTTNGLTFYNGIHILNITSSPTSSSGTIGGFAYTYRMSISTIKTQSSSNTVLVGDALRRLYLSSNKYEVDYFYVGYTSSSYAYLTKISNIQGKKAVELNTESLTFYKPLAYNSSNEPTAAAQLNANGLILSEGGIVAGTEGQSGFVYLSTQDYGSYSINSSSGISDWKEIIGTKFGVRADGTLYASNVNISGNLKATSLSTGTKTSSTSGTGTYIDDNGNIYSGSGSTNNFQVTSTGALTAGNATLTGGSIAGWSFNTTSLYKNNATPGAASNAMVISTGTSSSNSIGGSTGSQSWMLSAGTGFGVTTNGVLYATGASIYGSLYASKGYIGGWQIGTDGNKSLHNGNANTSPTPGEGVIILSKGITGPLTATGVLPANQNWTITAGNQFGVTTEGTMYASGAILKSVTLKDSYNRTRAAIDVNGLHIYDTNGYLKADFGNSINLYGGSSSEGDYPKVTLDVSLGIYLYGTSTSYTRINSDGLTITQNGVDLGFFGTQLINDISIPRAIVGSQDGASYILLQQDGMYMYGADTSKGPIMAITQGTNYIETGGLAENFEIEPKYLDEPLHKYADESAQSATYYGNTDFTSNPTKAVIKVGEYDSDVIKATYTIPLTYNSSTQVCSGTTSNCTVSYNVTYKTCTVTLEAGITTYLHNYSSSWLFEYNPLTDNTSVAKGATSATVNFLSTIKSGTSFSITDGAIIPTNLATFTAGTSATKTYTITQDLGESSSNITVTAVYNGAKRIQFTFSSALVDTYYFKFKDVQMYGVQIKGAAVYATSNLPDVSFTFGKREGDAGSYSTIIGRELIASRNDQTVVGRFNVSADGAFIVGNGSYNASTLTRSNACVIDWKGNMSLSGRLNIPNNSCKVLWTGGYYMSQGHIARFAAGERVSTQNHGIVLVWSAYENSAIKDYDWYYQFIPKWHVIAHAGQGVDCIMMNNAIASGAVCKKYVYVYDDRITGNSKNTAVGEGYANNTKVLRAVLGV